MIVWPITILALLFAHALTFHLMKCRIDDLQAALVAKRVLLGETTTVQSELMLEGGMVCRIGSHLVSANHPVILTIHS